MLNRLSAFEESSDLTREKYYTQVVDGEVSNIKNIGEETAVLDEA